MAIAVTLRASSSSAGNGTTASFTPASNSLLVVAYGVTDNNTGDIAAGLTASGGGWTYTSRIVNGVAGNFKAQQRWWTAPVTTGASMTITFGSGSAVLSSTWYVWEVTDYLTANPIRGSSPPFTSNAPTTGIRANIPSESPEPQDALFCVAHFDGDTTGTYTKTANASTVAAAVISNTAATVAASGLYRLSSSLADKQWDALNTGSMTLFSEASSALAIRGNLPTVTPATSGAVQVII